jgi:hypothetical protein
MSKESTRVTWQPPTAGAIEFFTIYDHPTDAPTAFVVRRAEVIRGKKEPVHREAFQAATLAAARALVPTDRVSLGRNQADDPKIVEVWV